MEQQISYSSHVFAQGIPLILKHKSVQHVVISPGSRNVPLVIGFTEDPYFKCHSVVDERSAGFYALGIAKKIGRPVVLVCTSGSALLNYYPAVIEAYYSNIPLVVISADRPRYLVDIHEDQTIKQPNLFQGHVEGSIDIKEDINFEQGMNQLQWVINRCVQRSGPIHVNVPFEEPLYQTVDTSHISFCNLPLRYPKDHYRALTDFFSLWHQCSKKMIVAGAEHFDFLPSSLIDPIVRDASVIFLTESLSNLKHEGLINHIDLFLEALTLEQKAMLQPDVLLTFGGKIISKKVKTYLRAYKPKYHFHVDIKSASDTFFAQVRPLKLRPKSFFEVFSKETFASQSDYQRTFKAIFENVKSLRDEYLKTCLFSDLSVFESILKTIPKQFEVHFSNSASIRYGQLFQLNNHSYCNRGVSGIDGCTGTAVGFQSVSDNPVLLITGDLSFLYDINGLWVNGIDKRFRVIVINNQGGGIFRIISDNQPTHFESFIETAHNKEVKHVAAHFDFDYECVMDLDHLNCALHTFYEETNKPKMLEVKTPRKENDLVLKGLFEVLKRHK